MEETPYRLCEGDGQDRLSQLPDSILHIILSKNILETRPVIRTCILSKRWRNLWASMPYLYFDDRDWTFLSDDDDEQTHTKFVDFVTSALLRRENTGLHTFRLHWFNSFYVHALTYLAGWVQYAVLHNVKKFDIELLLEDYFDEFEFPACVFTCQSLEDLNLYASGPYSQLPQVVRLSRLKNLRLTRFTASSLLLKALICGCPVLEELHMEGFKLEDPEICSSSLRKLKLFNNHMRGTRVRIAAPSLQLLEVDCNDIERLEVLLDNLSSLVRASFQTDDIDYDDYDEFDEPELLKFISPRSEDMIGKDPSKCKNFNNLAKLELYGLSMLNNFPAVAHFLQRSPNLKFLTLTIMNECSVFEERKFICQQRKIYLNAKCRENERIVELMTKFFNSKGSCFRLSGVIISSPGIFGGCLFFEFLYLVEI